MGYQPNIFNVWDWSELSQHPNITWDIIQNNMIKPQSQNLLSQQVQIQKSGFSGFSESDSEDN